MANLSQAWAANPSAVTITLTSLADNNARESTAIDVTALGNVLDLLLRIKTNGQAGGTGILRVFLYAALETASPIYTDGVTGSDAAFTAANIKNSVQLPPLQMNAATGVVYGPVGLAAFFGGALPKKLGLIIENKSGATLSATGGDHDVDVLPVFATST